MFILRRINKKDETNYQRVNYKMIGDSFDIVDCLRQTEDFKVLEKTTKPPFTPFAFIVADNARIVIPLSCKDVNDIYVSNGAHFLTVTSTDI